MEFYCCPAARRLLARANDRAGYLVRKCRPYSSSPKISWFAWSVPGHLSNQCSSVWSSSFQRGYFGDTSPLIMFSYAFRALCLPDRSWAIVSCSFQDVSSFSLSLFLHSFSHDQCYLWTCRGFTCWHCGAWLAFDLVWCVFGARSAALFPRILLYRGIHLITTDPLKSWSISRITSVSGL